jgi:multidrug efflux pump subunit AcrB
MAAFLPLMLLPGIVGKFMFVIPFVVTLALLISLVEAFWMMPVHVLSSRLQLDPQRRCAGLAQPLQSPSPPALRPGAGLCPATTEALRAVLCTLLVAICRHAARDRRRSRPVLRLSIRCAYIYVNVNMPASATLEETLAETQAVEQRVRQPAAKGMGPQGEARSAYANAGV